MFRLYTCVWYMYMYEAYRFSLFSWKGGGGWLALYCMNMYAYGEILTTLFTGLGYARLVSEHTYITYDWYNVHCPIILELTDSISNRELKNIDNQLFGGFGNDFAKKKIQQSCACIPFRRWDVAVKILVYTRFSIRKTVFLVMSCIYYIPMCKSNKVHVNDDTAEECKYYTWIANSECV